MSEQASEKDETTFIKIDVPEQGVQLSLSKEEAMSWLDGELNFYQKHSSSMNAQLSWFGRNVDRPNIASDIARDLNKLRKNLGSDSSALDQYLSDARRLEVILSQGHLGKQIASIVRSGDREQLAWTLLLYSKRWSGAHVNELLAPIRAAIFSHPAAWGSYRLATADAILTAATDARNTSVQSADNMKTVLEERQSSLKNLEDLYRKKLPLEQPAILWKTTATTKQTLWQKWLSLFAIMILVPLGFGAYHWAAMLAIIKDIAGANAGGVNLAGLAAITVPVLLYGWLLKNVSRVFMQAMALSDDAELRHSLAYTFLGLAANKDVAIAENERALILNALFRPLPTNSTVDAGPPSGLLELIKGKGS